jgi:uncharacterized membrane protein
LRNACSFLDRVLTFGSEDLRVLRLCPDMARHTEVSMMNGLTMGLEGWLWMGVWVLALVVMVWLLVREPRRNGRDDALDTLRSRFARGEISQAEFEAARRLLES